MEAHESTRKRLEITPLRDHEDHIAHKGFYNLEHKFFPMPQAMEVLGAKAATKNERSSKSCQRGN